MIGRPERELSGQGLPLRLRDLSRPPPSVFLRGELPRGPTVAVVGTREPSSEALEYTRTLVAAFVAAGIAILSGGARGIDAAAHREALSGGGMTVVVAPSGFERPYPPEHASLFESVLESGGGYLSLVPAGVAPTRPGFHARNAALVALSHAVVIVQAPAKSGALSAARAARRIGRPLFVVPASPWDERGAGCIAELRRGARMLVAPEQVVRLLEELRYHGVPAYSSSEAPRFGGERQLYANPMGTNPSAERRQSGTLALPFNQARERETILEVLRSGACHPDEIATRTGWPVRRIQQLLLTLTLDGVVVLDPAGCARIITC